MTLSEAADDRTRDAAPARGAARARGAAQATSQYLGVLAVLGLLVVLLAVTQPEFLTVDNFLNIAELNVVLLLLAVGLTFVLLTGGIDLSVGSMMGFSAIVCWKLLGTMPAPLAMLLAVLVALAAAFATNGLLIGRAGLSFLVVTIGTGSLLHGLAQIWSGGQSQTVYQHSFLVSVGTKHVAGVPVTVLIAAGVFAVALVVLRYSGFGRMVYAVGGNPEAARLAGINVTAVRVAVYTLCGTLAGLAGVISAARITSASPDAGIGLELTAGAAVLLGGTSFMGGRGSLLGTLLGVLFLGVLQNGVTLAGVSPFWSNVVSGAVLIVAIGIDRLRTGKAMP
ncbi:ABC transporter permease [Actinomadura parmotrematis]|uniref:ABC transporter permease n=1 Tax=Actinomadura parmotrematis TaxID=2864039 RepID=A0ABS7FZX1_9ACTN|nr:ABC transporter permease [Actinomadura parmotrematis]MBW8485851.1 ABC transporter permease [Actinomadura parmotrematis]